MPILGVHRGSIAQQFAIDDRDPVRRLVLLASACRLSAYRRQAHRSLARFTEAGQPRRAWAAMGGPWRRPQRPPAPVPGKGHVGVMGHKPMIEEIRRFLTGAEPPTSSGEPPADSAVNGRD